ncbi:spermatogenesis-associated protein 17 [Microcaecilia unicolor]|uniref:Spermatogenesis-associated protein 17 n=1 Tax=Microcaecilia unicolor TaxID=1415580 RepID=A0A6P7X4I1_9AMPH|nr:spermatogenesis-associated protein 17 [Microcaecilia unicolor]
MAMLLKLQSRFPVVRAEQFHRYRLAEDYRIIEYKAAVKIQSWFQGCRVRAYIRSLHRRATIIQKTWRGYLGRKCYRMMVQAAYFNAKMNFFNEMAVRIQKLWRGYYVRKYVHNCNALQKYFEEVTRNNEIVRQQLEEFAEMKQRERDKKEIEMEERKKNYQARKMHYLVSTRQIAGIYNSPYRQFPDEMEFRLQKAKPLNHWERQTKDDSCGLVDMSTDTTSFSFPTIQPLPPIGKQKPQGPFRDTAEVLQQRYKPLEPTLRVETLITSLEEARAELKRKENSKCISDDLFLPFSSLHKNRKYIPSLDTSFGYKVCSFRTVEQEKWISKKDFKTVFTSFPLFNKFGRTYSKAGEIV